MKHISLKHIMQAAELLPDPSNVDSIYWYVNIVLDCKESSIGFDDSVPASNPNVIRVDFIKINGGTEWALVDLGGNS